MNVTLFQESLLKIDPIIAEAIAPRAAAIVKYSIGPSFDLSKSCHEFVQFAFHTSWFIKNKPKTINPNKLTILITVNVVWIIFPLCTPRELMYVSKMRLSI